VKLQLRWTEQAVEQLGSIADYISLSSPVYAEAVVGRISTRIQGAIDYPEIGVRVPELDTPEIRQLIEWPYRIIYRRQATAIEVLAIVHGRRDLGEVKLG
jgi:plasmid stabilization system protein ParE